MGTGSESLNAAKQKLTELKLAKSDAAQFGYNQADLSLRTAVYNYLAKLDRLIAQQEKIVAEAAEAEAEARKSGCWPAKRKKNWSV